MTFGPGQIGSLKNGDGRELRVYVNGKQIKDPATYVIKKNDNIVIAFGDGQARTIDLTPDTKRLRDTNAGKEGCGAERQGRQGPDELPDQRTPS